jgi:hypothetical protein
MATEVVGENARSGRAILDLILPRRLRLQKNAMRLPGSDATGGLVVAGGTLCLRPIGVK